MGIIANAKQYIAKKATEVAERTSDRVAKAATLSPEQLQQIDAKRISYLTGKPDMDSDEVQELIGRNLGAVGVEVYQAYLEQLKKTYLPVDIGIEKFDSLNRIRYFDVTKWVTDPKEKNLDKLVNVYQVLNEEECNIALIYNRSQMHCKVTMAVINTDIEQADPAKADSFCERLSSALKGNFPGVETSGTFLQGEPECLSSFINDDQDDTVVKSVAIVSNLASDKSEDFISQSMEKLLDGIIPETEDEEYTLVLLAKPITNQLDARNRLFELYSVLSPYSTWQTNYTYTESDSLNSSATFGMNLGLTAGINASHGLNRTKLHDEKKGDSAATKVGKGIVGKAKQLVGLYAPEQETSSVGYNASANFGVNFSRASSVTAQIGKNEGITQNYTNFGVKHTLDVLEKQLKRMDESSALGMWEFASYVVAKSPVVANNVAHMYLALTQGDESFMTRASVNLWDGEEENDEAETILRSVQKLQHPVFGLKDSDDENLLLYPTLVTTSAVLSGKELAKALNFPRKSVSGLPVLESAPFGREVQKISSETENSNTNAITIGNVFHMRRDEAATLSLSVNDLTSHTFVTGSTGTGKSNAIYQLLNQLSNKNIHFLVVEPAKGEYKKVFGGRCKVFGTNISKTELLQINPFSFPSDIHVLEHIDRLIEIFNACWPMYAAMPAILKDAVEKSYERVGWNLRFSKCEPIKFPTFNDLIETLPEVMDSSLYSADTKNDYAGALITRVRSLTNGINGHIFCSGRELSDNDLFNQDVIVDLSRVGSNETKSLMMGILVMKLQEYRMQLDAMNEDLIHVTVLEEAHNLLRRTSVAQTQEGSNLQGKSVEMITNSIAEMRTYGEGFIIADQSPELLDEAVIRNTNTKIVLRLPNQKDRELVGTSMALSEEQIVELAKLPKGVAAVYQNDWVEAVLCHFKKYTDKTPLCYTPMHDSSAFEKFFAYLFGITEHQELSDEEVDTLKDWINSLRETKGTIKILNAALSGTQATEREREVVAYNIFEGKRIACILAAETDVAIGIENANKKIMSTMGFAGDILIEAIRKSIMDVVFRMNEHGELQQRYRSFEAARRTIV